MVEIPIGAEITFLKDDSFTASVTGDREIEFDGEKTSLNQASLDILNSQFDKSWSSVRGPDYWIYEGETLTERRMRMEE